MTTASTSPRLQRAVLPADGVRANDILLLSVLDGERPLRHIGQERLLRAGAQFRGHKVIDFGQNRPGQQPLVRPILIELANRGVMTIAAVEQREDRAGVGDDHRERPIPFNRSSARSLRSRRPLAKAPTLFAARRGS